MNRTLEDWLDYQLHTHQQAIAMGLDRVREVARRLGIGKPGKHVMMIGGTNGKGSTVAFAEAIARAAGLRVGAFTSPHLLKYNERIRVDGRDADDATGWSRRSSASRRRARRRAWRRCRSPISSSVRSRPCWCSSKQTSTSPSLKSASAANSTR